MASNDRWSFPSFQLNMQYNGPCYVTPLTSCNPVMRLAKSGPHYVTSLSSCNPVMRPVESGARSQTEVQVSALHDEKPPLLCDHFSLAEGGHVRREPLYSYQIKLEAGLLGAKAIFLNQRIFPFRVDRSGKEGPCSGCSL